MKNSSYYLIGGLLGLGASVLIFLTAMYGSPEGAFDAAVELMETDVGKTLGLVHGSLFLLWLAVHSLGEALYYRKKADQKETDQL